MKLQVSQDRRGKREKSKTGEALHQIRSAIEEEKLIRKPCTVKCSFMFDIYGIVKVENIIVIKVNILYLLVTLSFLNKGNPKMSIVYCSALNIINQIVTLLGKRSFISRSSPGGQSSFHVQTTWLVFQCCEATGALYCISWEILQKLAELHSTADVPLTPTDGILYS